jgi:hypothetical protein
MHRCLTRHQLTGSKIGQEMLEQVTISFGNRIKITVCAARQLLAIRYGAFFIVNVWQFSLYIDHRI